jgi:hypothetical protein
MNCFQHHERTAVGLCKHCARGLCSECATDEGYGLACKGRCEAEVKNVSQLLEKSKSAYRRNSAVYLRASALYGLMGLFLLVFPYLLKTQIRELFYLFEGMGILFLLGAILQLVNARRMKKT